MVEFPMANIELAGQNFPRRYTLDKPPGDTPESFAYVSLDFIERVIWIWQFTPPHLIAGLIFEAMISASRPRPVSTVPVGG